MKPAWLLACVALSCGPGARGGPTMNNRVGVEDPPPSSVISTDILAREAITNKAHVKHILIGWKFANEEGALDPRAAVRSKHDAEEVVTAILGQIKSGAEFEALMKKYSEDPGSASSGREYAVSPESNLVIEFKQLGMRLRVGEVGVVQSDYGFHVIKRVD